MKINGAPGKTGNTSPSAPMTISTPAAIQSTIVTVSTTHRFDAASAAAII